MTIKELYKLAQAAGAEDYKIKVSHRNRYSLVKLDYIAHGAKVVVLTDVMPLSFFGKMAELAKEGERK